MILSGSSTSEIFLGCTLPLILTYLAHGKYEKMFKPLYSSFEGVPLLKCEVDISIVFSYSMRIS